MLGTLVNPRTGCIGAVLFGLGIGMAAPVSASVTLTDVVDVHAYSQGSPSSCCGFVGGWGGAGPDAPNPSNPNRIVYDRTSATTATFRLFTQFNGFESIGGGQAVRYADLFIDTGTPLLPGGMTYGVSLGYQAGNGGHATAGLYSITGSNQVKTSQDI